MMSLGEKIKIVAVLGGFGLVLALAIGLVAARKPGVPVEVSGRLIGIHKDQDEEPGPSKFIVELNEGNKIMLVPPPGVAFQKDASVVLLEYPMTIGAPRYQWKRYWREEQ